MAFREVCDQPVLSTWQKLMDYLLVRLSHERNEQFWILFLDRKNCLTFELKVAEGTVDHVPVYPREVVRLALQHDASALLIVHNHPSGDPAPSKADIEITRQLSNALSVINVSLHDHVIVGTGGKYTSFKTNGLF
ncbi:RadC family protein [Niveispirillum sp.]|uniref:JAB domain-containing protein n=1 Tax=Niveispirillum sp. TaxID=1917217 RepID=UPI001B7B65D6|nr:DNA repair protein RadC [Niveispirillum sp.]MBP7339274.1 DNA repair protein RadC [Niveispirillum sp.]